MRSRPRSRRPRLLLALLLLAAAVPALAAAPRATPKKKAAKTPVKAKVTPAPTPKKTVCPDLLEQKMSLGLDLDAQDAALAEKRAALTALQAEATKDAPVVDLTGETPADAPVDVTATPAPAPDPSAKEKIASLQTEIAELEASRLDLARKLERVKSTYAQSCPSP